MAAQRALQAAVTPEIWERLKPLFEEAAALPPAERGAFVEKVRLEDESTGRDLMELLAATEEADSLDQPVVDFHRTLRLSALARRIGPEDETTRTALPISSQVLGERYRVIRHIGKGGMGDVYEAEDLRLGQRVALKTIRPEIADDPVAVARFKTEIVMAQKVSHPNVCRIHGLGVHKRADGHEMLFLTMEYLDGETVSSRLKRGPMDPAEALPLIEGMADGLSAAHKAGVIHRDFKSSNVMLVPEEGGTRAVITDFGLAKPSRPAPDRTALTKTGAVAGTLRYMSPEQINGDVLTPAADIYALGIVVYEMVTGRLPFTGDSEWSIILHHLNDPPPPPTAFAPHLDATWETAILACLKKAPGERFQSAAEFRTALSSGARLIPAPPKPAKRLAPILASLALLLAVILGGVLFTLRQKVFPSTPSQQRVAILEFENIGGDPVNQAFCDGLMQTLAGKLTELEQFQGSLSVVPASDIRREKVTSAREAQREFGVNLAVTGSVQRSPGGVRLIVNLVDARQLKQLRSHVLFVPQTDAVSMQQGVVTQVTDLLNIQLRPEVQQRIAQGATPVPGAYDFYLQGTGYLLAGRGGVDQAIAEFRHALDLDPDYALAHAGLGEAYWNKYSATKDRQWIDQAWRECNSSVELGPQLAPAHVTLAVLNSGAGHYDEAIRQARQALDLDPGNDRAYSELARALTATNQPDAAEATWKKAIALRPGYWNNYVRLGIFYVNHGKYQQAVPVFTRVVELVPDNPAGYTDLGSTYHLLGRESEAEQMLRKSIQVKPTDLAYSNLATVYFFEQRYADAVPIYEKLAANGAKDYGIWGNLGDAYRWTPGNGDKAAATYRHAIDLATQALAVNPRDVLALINLALYSAKTGQMADAGRNMEKALLYAPDDKTILFNAAIVCELTGNRARALEFLGRAIHGGYSLNEIAVEPELGKLRQDASYKTLVAVNNGH